MPTQYERIAIRQPGAPYIALIQMLPDVHVVQPAQKAKAHEMAGHGTVEPIAQLGLQSGMCGLYVGNGKRKWIGRGTNIEGQPAVEPHLQCQVGRQCGPVDYITLKRYALCIDKLST